MAEPIPVILCGQREQVGSAVIAGLKPDYEVVQFILTPEACIAEIPELLRGRSPATSSSALGTGSISDTRRPQAIILGGGYAQTFDQIRSVVEGQFADTKGSGVIWLRHDGEKPAPTPGTPEYGKAMIERVREQFTKLKEEGKLGSGVGEVRWY